MTETKKPVYHDHATWIDSARSEGVESIVILLYPDEDLPDDEQWGFLSSTDDKKLILRMLDRIKRRVTSGEFARYREEIDGTE